MNVTCLQECDTLPIFCQPFLFYGSSEATIFPEALETRILEANCSYYSYTLVNVNVTDLVGHKLSCGGRLRSGNYRLSDPPLMISVKSVQSELLLMLSVNLPEGPFYAPTLCYPLVMKDY